MNIITTFKQLENRLMAINLLSKEPLKYTINEAIILCKTVLTYETAPMFVPSIKRNNIKALELIQALPTTLKTFCNTFITKELEIYNSPVESMGGETTFELDQLFLQR